MSTRIAHARWEGSLKEGEGKIDFGNGLFVAPYTFVSRFEHDAGTNPEELLGAAHAGCFAMALSLILGEAGFTPAYIDATASVTIAKRDSSFSITKILLNCEAKVPGLDATAFAEFAEIAKVNCPVSKALTGTEIALEAVLR